MAAARDFTESPELAAIVRRYLAAYAVNDVETMLNFYSDSAAVRYQGTAEEEFWDGATLRAIMPGYVETKPVFTIEKLDISAFERGDVGFVAFRGQVAFAAGKSAAVRGTHLYTLDRGQWQLVHVHFSSPHPNTENMGYEAKGLEDLLQAAATTPLDIGQTGIASVMFTDIADSTALAQTLGDTVWSKVVKDHLEQVSDLVLAQKGKLVKSLGDGTLSAFPSASAALKAAISIQRATAANSGEPHLRLRVGVHTGDVVETGGDYLGTVVNKAARVAAMAAPDDIRVSDATRIMVGGAREFTFSDPATVPLKGLDGEHLIYRLVWRE